MHTETISNGAVVETDNIGEDSVIAEFAIVRRGVKIGRNVIIHPFVVIESGTVIGDGVEIFPGTHIGKEPKTAGALAREPMFDRHVSIGERCCIGPNAVIYCDVEIGDSTLIGDGASVREHCRIGSKSVLGSHATLGDDVVIGSHTKVLNHCTLAGTMRVGNNVFISNDVQTANDNQFGRKGWRADQNRAPIVEDNAMIGVGAILLPGITVGKGAIIGSGAIVTASVKPEGLILTAPGRVVPRALHQD